MIENTISQRVSLASIIWYDSSVNDDYYIPRSKTPIIAQIITSGIMVLFACLFVSFFFYRVVTFAPDVQSVLMWTLWLTLPPLWLIGSAVTLRKWPKATYVLTSDSLKISKKGWLGASSESLYRYDSILTLTMTKSPLGDFGTITITLAQLSPLTLRAVAQPRQNVEKIKAKVSKSQPITQTVLS
ncbi:MAG: hypothetical protein WAS27_04165 [Candidatus Saccharimonadales bacterium]